LISCFCFPLIQIVGLVVKIVSFINQEAVPLIVPFVKGRVLEKHWDFSCCFQVVVVVVEDKNPLQSNCRSLPPPEKGGIFRGLNHPFAIQIGLDVFRF
jgi:hypothetical protein